MKCNYYFLLNETWRQLVIETRGNSRRIQKINIILKLKQEVAGQWVNSVEKNVH